MGLLKEYRFKKISQIVYYDCRLRLKTPCINNMTLHCLVLRVREYNMGRVKKVEKIERVRGVERMQKVKGVKKAIGAIRKTS